MAKKKTEDNVLDMDKIYKDLAKETDGDVLEDLDAVKFCIDTGNLAINFSCSGRFVTGGIPGNRITEAYGPEGSGKSLIGSNALAAIQFLGGWAILLDCENASNAEFMKKVSHLNVKQVIRHSPSSLERAFRTIHVVAKRIREKEKELGMPRKPIFVMFDSLTVPPCERELRENDLPLDYSPADWKKLVGRQEQPGERAKIISAEMRKLQAMVKELDVTVYLINQIRDKIGVLYGSPETTPGGNAVKFYASLRIRTAAKKKIEHMKLETFSGINMQVKNVKNRMFRPFVVADDVKLFFSQGIDPLSGLLNALVESERVVMKSAGNYTVADTYLPEGTPMYNFKASKGENRLGKEVIIDCPKLVDAVDSAEVEKYLTRWGSGLAATESGDYTEKDVSFDAQGDAIDAAVNAIWDSANKDVPEEENDE